MNRASANYNEEDAVAPTHSILDEGDIWVMIDGAREVYYIDALPDSSPATLHRLFLQLESYGLTLMEEDDGEYEPPELPSGHIRRFLVPDWD